MAINTDIVMKATTRSSTRTGSRSRQPRLSTSLFSVPASATLALKAHHATPQGRLEAGVEVDMRSSQELTKVRWSHWRTSTHVTRISEMKKGHADAGVTQLGH